MKMRFLFLFIFSTVIYTLSISLYAHDRTIVLGKKEGWTAFQKKEGLATRIGRGGFEDLVIAESEYPVDSSTDLLMHFNTTPVKEETGHYVVQAAAVGINEKNARLGHGAGVFTGTDGIVLAPRSGVFYGSGPLRTDFSIEFWLYPAALEEGELIFAWKGFRRHSGKLIPQKLECRTRRRALVWSFDNIFTVAGEPFQFELQSVERLVPRQWRHHLFRYHQQEGILEYLVDGQTVGSRMATLAGTESSQPCVPMIGESELSVITIGSSFTGFMDELRVSTEYVDSPHIKRYASQQGRAVSRIFDLGFTGTIVKRVNALLEQPADSEIDFFIRVSDSFDTFEQLKSEWRPFMPGTAFDGSLKGRYVQLMAEFYPDGSRDISPRLFEVQIVFEPAPAPPSPAGFKVLAGNGQVTLSWKPVLGGDVKGYLVFYGEASLQYLGREAREGKSPIDVGTMTTVTLTGLTNGKLYYFTVAAYDFSTPPHISEFSREQSARPSEVKR